MKYDEETLKPFFIRNYSRVRQLLEDEYQVLLKKQTSNEIKEEDILIEKVEAFQATLDPARRLKANSMYDKVRPDNNLGIND